MKVLTKQDLVDILVGCTVFGTGGGGSLEEGLKIIQQDLRKGRQFKLIDLKEVPEEAQIASPYACGSVSPTKEKVPIVEPIIAFSTLQDYLGKEFFAAIATELGGMNTAVAFSTAANLGIPLVNADPAGRSVPELQHTTFFLNHVPITPLGVASRFGDVVIIKGVVDDFHAESVVRSIAVINKGRVGVADHPVDGTTLKKSVISNTISHAFNIGKSVRESKQKDEDPIQAILSVEKGFLCFKGQIKKDSVGKERDGFTFGNIYIKGIEEYKGSEYKIWYKNENLIGWKDEKPDVTVPDLICILNRKTSYPITNPNCKKGIEVAVIGFPAPKQWRTRRGLQLFGPRSFGFDIEYTPIEKLKK